MRRRRRRADRPRRRRVARGERARACRAAEPGRPRGAGHRAGARRRVLHRSRVRDARAGRRPRRCSDVAGLRRRSVLRRREHVLRRAHSRRRIRVRRAGDRADVPAVDEVRVHVIAEHVRAMAEHVRSGRVEVEPHDRATVPVVVGRGGRPTDVLVARLAGAPDDPRRRVLTPGDPRPTAAVGPDPAAVVERHPAEALVVVADPDPVVVRVDAPVTVRDVRSEVAADRRRCRDPHRAVRRVFHPGAVRIEGRLELAQRAGVGVGVRVGLRRLLRLLGSLRRDFFRRGDAGHGSRCARILDLFVLGGRSATAESERRENQERAGGELHAPKLRLPGARRQPRARQWASCEVLLIVRTQWRTAELG